MSNDNLMSVNLPKDFLIKSNTTEKGLLRSSNANSRLLFGANKHDLKKSNSSDKNQRIISKYDPKDFRKENNYVPKLRINKISKIKKEENISKKKYIKSTKNNYKGIMSLYNSETLHPISNYIEEKNISLKENLKNDEEAPRTKIIRNNIDYDNVMKPLFFANSYLEYSYQDKGDNLYDDGDLFRFLFAKKKKKDKNDELIIAEHDSLYFENYITLLKQMEEEYYEDKNINNIDYYNMKNEVNFNVNLSNEEKNRIKKYKKKKNEKNDSENSENLKPFFLEKLNEYEKNKNNLIATEEKEEISENTNNKKFLSSKNNFNINISKLSNNNPTLGKKPEDVFFNIDIQGKILKKIKNNSGKEIPYTLKISGPIVTLNKAYSDKNGEILKLKKKFDLRFIKMETSQDNVNDKINTTKDTDEFIVKKFYNLDDEIIFKSQKIKELHDKSYKFLFAQLQKYYKEFILNIDKASYNVLKYLSDPKCTYLELSLSENKKLLEHIYWHPQIQNLSIPSSYVSTLNQVMESKDWECILTTLTITKDSGVSSPPFEESIYLLFSNINSLSIQNIHFIDIPYKKNITDALFKHIEIFYNVNYTTIRNHYRKSLLVSSIGKDQKKILNFVKNNSNFLLNIKENNDDVIEINTKEKYFQKMQKSKLPIINLSLKKSMAIDNNYTKSEEPIDLRAVYYLLMEMVIKSYIFNNNSIPEVFNKLDLSGSTVSDAVGFLTKIITQFKIIKELDISGTKSFSHGKVINSPYFLRKIKLTNYFYQEDEKNFIEKIKKEIEDYKNSTEQQRSEMTETLDDEQMSYNYLFGIFPILEKIYVYSTEIKEEISKDIYMLFKKLKFFNGFYSSPPPYYLSSDTDRENNVLLNTITSLTEEIKRDNENFCENVFMFNSDVITT